jgi:hypothetical protein
MGEGESRGGGERRGLRQEGRGGGERAVVKNRETLTCKAFCPLCFLATCRYIGKEKEKGTDAGRRVGGMGWREREMDVPS